jgi:hypothetical protein
LCHTYLGLTAKDSGRERAAELHLAEAIELLAPVHDVAILGIAIAALAAVEARRAPRRALVLAAAAARVIGRVGATRRAPRRTSMLYEPPARPPSVQIERPPHGARAVVCCSMRPQRSRFGARHSARPRRPEA